MAIPEEKKGWSTKHSRHAIIGNWKERYFLLSEGELSYYTTELMDERKGTLILKGAKIANDPKYHEEELYLIVKGDEDIHLRFLTKEDREKWAKAFTEHIEYYKSKLFQKTCLVLGATGNVGGGVALAYANLGGRVIATGRSMEKLQKARELWKWPKSVIAVVADFSTDEEAEASIKRIWKTTKSGDIVHVCNSLGFGEVVPPISKLPIDKFYGFLDKFQGPRLRSTKLVTEKLLHVSNSTITNVSGGFMYGTHKFDGGSAHWMNAVGASIYQQCMYAVAAEVRDKKGRLRSSTACVHLTISKPGETKQQFGMPAEHTSSVQIGKAIAAIALDTKAQNGHTYDFDKWENVEDFVAKITK